MSENFNSTHEFIEESLDNVTEKLKTTFLEMLKKGFNIDGKKTYDSIKALVEKFTDLQLCNYEEVESSLFVLGGNYSKGKHIFSCAIDIENKRLDLYPEHEGPFSTSYGYIQDGKFINSQKLYNIDLASNNESELSEELQNLIVQDELVRKKQAEYETKQDKLAILKMIEKIKQQQDAKSLAILRAKIKQRKFEEAQYAKSVATLRAKLIQKKQNQKQIEQLPELDFGTYIVRKGDTLSKIIKKYYGLTTNRDVANVINKVKAYNPVSNNGETYINSRPTDDIFGGDKIALPKTINFRKQIFNRK